MICHQNDTNTNKENSAKAIRAVNISWRTGHSAIPWLGMDIVASVNRKAKVRPSSDASLQHRPAKDSHTRNFRKHQYLW